MPLGERESVIFHDYTAEKWKDTNLTFTCLFYWSYSCMNDKNALLWAIAECIEYCMIIYAFYN